MGEDSRVGGSHLVWTWPELGIHINDEHAENGPACVPLTQYPVLDVQRAHGDEEVLKSSSHFFVYSRSDSSCPLRKTVKKSARVLFVLSGSKGSFKAEWGLQCEVINASMVTGRGRHVKLNDHGLSLSVHSALALIASCQRSSLLGVAEARDFTPTEPPLLRSEI